MKSAAKTADDYLLEVPEKRMNAIQTIRNLCLANLPDHEEGMMYGMPSYKRNNQVEVAFASQKQHICVYFLIHEVMQNNEEKLQGLNHGKGCIRFPNPTKIDFELLTDLLEQTAKSTSASC